MKATQRVVGKDAQIPGSDEAEYLKGCTHAVKNPHGEGEGTRTKKEENARASRTGRE